jgi:hypothetical protein
MNPDTDDRLENGEAKEALQKVKEHLAKEDDQLNQLEEHIQEAEKKRKQVFDPKT